MMEALPKVLRPLVVHIVFRFDTGGLENGVVNLINTMPDDAFRHAVIALTEVVPAFAARVVRDDVLLVGLHKPPGQAFRVYRPLLAQLRAWQPSVVHSRNLAALECQPVAAWAGVPLRIHSEHGRDAEDPHGLRRRYQWIRRLYAPYVHHQVALSRDLADYLIHNVGIARQRVTQIYNGVDVDRFRPALAPSKALAGCPFDAPGAFLVGTVGRMSTVKAQPILARAFVRALDLAPALRKCLRLVMVGDGPLRAEVARILQHARAEHLAWLPGERADVPDVMRALDCFVLPSLAEGISNTILEAMATALPVVATDVGGNADLVLAGQTGLVVPADNVEALAHALVSMAAQPGRARAMGLAGRARVEQHFSLKVMVDAYQGLYQRLLAQRLTYKPRTD